MSLKLFSVGQKSVVLDEFEKPLMPFSLFVNESANPHTQNQRFSAVRILYAFMRAHDIELLERVVVDNGLLSDQEARNLRDLCYFEIEAVESMGKRELREFFSAKKDIKIRGHQKSVKQNTAAQRADYIAKFLLSYADSVTTTVLHGSAQAQVQLQRRAKKNAEDIGNIRTTDSNHHQEIISLPPSRFLEIIKWSLQKPHEIFGEKYFHLNQALFHLACEGLRPGMMLNIFLRDFDDRKQVLFIEDHRDERVGPVSKKTGVMKGGVTDKRSSIQSFPIRLFPFTVRSLKAYIENARSNLAAKNGRNLSQGFLFLNNQGKPFASTTSLENRFDEIGKNLERLGLLDSHYDTLARGDKYPFYAYVMRHSAATFFMSEHREHENESQRDSAYDKMRLRFGWTAQSNMPAKYAKRALMAESSKLLQKIDEDLHNEMIQTIRN